MTIFKDKSKRKGKETASGCVENMETEI
jgi:hypothetical protein